MTRPMKNKSGTFREVKRKTPGAKLTVQHKKRNPSIAKCGNCGAKLAGIPRKRPFQMANLPKTKKRPERPFGGALCTKCTRQLMKDKARA